MVSERREVARFQEVALTQDKTAGHPELARARTFALSLNEEWRSLFDVPLAQATRGFAQLQEEEVALEAHFKGNEERLRQATSLQETALAAVAAAQHELAIAQSPEHIKARARYKLAAPQAGRRILGRVLRRFYGTGPEPNSTTLENARAEAAQAAKQLTDVERQHTERRDELRQRQEQLARRPANIAHQLHVRMEQAAAPNQEITTAYVLAYPENAIRAAHTFAETHAEDTAVIGKYFPDFCVEVLHQKETAKRAQTRPLYQRLERKRPGEPISITDLTRTEIVYWIDYISYRFLRECWEGDSHRPKVIQEPIMPKLV